MEWYNILALFLSALGGVSGIVGIYHAKSKKDTLDISNMAAIIKEEREERAQIKSEFDTYKKSVDERIIMFKGEFAQLKEDNQRFLTSILQAYRCPLPQSLEDCPVLRAHKDTAICEECSHKSAV